MVVPIIEAIWARGATPLIVGGSGFYVQSLLFPPIPGPETQEFNEKPDWDLLFSIDPQRAKNIHPHDTYRISRALNIWKTTGLKPSTLQPSYKPLGRTYVVWVTRDKKQLDERINKRVFQMIDQGWLDECHRLIDTPWEAFLRRKKLIGYCQLFDYLKGTKNLKTLADAIAVIQQMTCSYAKRQITFWNMLKRHLEGLADAVPPVITYEVNLTLEDPRLYINQLSQVLKYSPEQRMS